MTSRNKIKHEFKRPSRNCFFDGSLLKKDALLCVFVPFWRVLCGVNLMAAPDVSRENRWMCVQVLRGDFKPAAGQGRMCLRKDKPVRSPLLLNLKANKHVGAGARQTLPRRRPRVRDVTFQLLFPLCKTMHAIYVY